MALLHDMHCHLDFMENGEEVAECARAAGTLLFANTVTPDGWRAACERFAAHDNVLVGFGMHPWWIGGKESGDSPEGDGQCAVAGENARVASSQRAEHRRLAEAGPAPAAGDPRVDAFCEELLARLREADSALIGEVGLDFGWRHLETRSIQLEAFARIARWAGERGGRLLSLHSIKAAREVLDILDNAGALRSCTCLFHWFSGSGDQLKRAIEAGCYFSCGPRMLATGKGREYVKAIPASRLLLETDAPPVRGERYSFDALRDDLESAAASVAAIKGERALETIAATSARLLGT